MATNVIMPALGVAQQTGTLLKWLKAEGQAVSKGEPLMEIETDKATVEIEAPGSGISDPCDRAKPAIKFRSDSASRHSSGGGTRIASRRDADGEPHTSGQRPKK